MLGSEMPMQALSLLSPCAFVTSHTTHQKYALASVLSFWKIFSSASPNRKM